MKKLFLVTSLALLVSTAPALVPADAASDIPFAVTAQAEDATSGECGEGLTWELDSDGVLTISGSGTEIAEYAFANNKSIRSVVIPSNITTLGRYAFSGCTSLEEASVPAAILRGSDFGSCPLKTLTITGSGAIPAEAMKACNTVESVTITSDITEIGALAFAGCIKLKSIEVPSHITSIGDSAFMDCTSLASVTVPCSLITSSTFARSAVVDLTLTGSGAAASGIFAGNTRLKNVTISKDITSIGNSAFAGCSNLESVNFESGSTLTAVGDSAFNASGITEISLPSTVTSIGQAAFYGSAIASIAIPDSVNTLSTSAFLNCTNLNSVTFGADSQLTMIDAAVFNGCTSLTQITLPESLTSIGDSSFYNTGITSIVIPSGVTSIGKSIVDDDCSVICYADKDTAVDPSNSESYSITYVPNITNSSMASGNISDIPQTVYDASNSDKAVSLATDGMQVITILVDVNNKGELSKYAIALKNNGVTVESGVGTYKSVLADMNIIQVVLSTDTAVDEVELVLYDSNSNAAYTESIKASAEV